MSYPIDDQSPDITSILAISALFAALCRLFPVPFLDRFLLMEIKRRMIISILNLHDIDIEIGMLYPLYRDHKGCWYKLSIYPFFFIFIIIWKIFKRILRFIFFFLFIRDAAKEMGHIILFGHTIERCLLDGRIEKPEGVTYKKGRRALFRSSVRCKKRFIKVYKGADFRFIIYLFKSVIQNMVKFPDIAVAVKNILLKSKESEKLEKEFEKLNSNDKSKLKEILESVVQILKKDETKSFIAEFDRLFDGN